MAAEEGVGRESAVEEIHRVSLQNGMSPVVVILRMQGGQEEIHVVPNVFFGLASKRKGRRQID